MVNIDFSSFSVSPLRRPNARIEHGQSLDFILGRRKQRPSRRFQILVLQGLPLSGFVAPSPAGPYSKIIFELRMLTCAV